MSDIKMLHLYSCELDAPTREVTLPAPLMHQDAYADVFRIHVTRGGLDLQLSGMTVRAWLYLAATGETMLLEGSADGSMAMVTLQPECYLFPGYATLAIQLQQGEDCRTLIKIDLAIKRTSTDVVIDPSNVLPTLPELLAQIAAMEQATAAANTAAEAANAAAANAQEFIVTVTTPAYIIDGDTSGIKADKTYAEIQAAINAGKTPVVKLKTSGQVQTKILHLSMTAPASIVFREHTQEPSTYNTAGSTRCTFLSTGGIIWDSAEFRTVPDDGTEGQVLVKTGDSTYGWKDSGELAAVTALTEEIDRNTAPAIIPTATGGIVTITDGAARPAVEVISHIAPVQEGSGDPSPDNVRPISGWNAAEINRSGKNLLPEVVVVSGVFLKALVQLKAGVTYTLSVQQMPDFLYFSNEGGSVDYAVNTGSMSLTFTVETTGRYSVLARYEGGANVAYNMMLEIGSIATAYEPYQDQTFTAALPEAVYGGKMDWKTGELKATHAIVLLTGEETGWSAYDDTMYNNNIITGAQNDPQKNRFIIGICSHVASDDAYLHEQVRFGDIQSDGSAYGVQFYSIASYWGISAGDTNAWKTYLAAQYEAGTPVQIVYKLATPYTIQLAPQQLDMLKGTNNVWSDCGDTTLSYVADTKMYIDQKLAAIAAATI